MNKNDVRKIPKEYNQFLRSLGIKPVNSIETVWYSECKYIKDCMTLSGSMSFEFKVNYFQEGSALNISYRSDNSGFVLYNGLVRDIEHFKTIYKDVVTPKPTSVTLSSLHI